MDELHSELMKRIDEIEVDAVTFHSKEGCGLEASAAGRAGRSHERVESIHRRFYAEAFSSAYFCR